ncbi:MAG: SIMPL domain-containing protein [Sulfitobacter sp.]
MKALKLSVLIWVFCAGFASAQAVEQGISVTGEGRVSMPPDMATITLGVTENAATAGAVMAQVNASVASILKELDALGVAAEDRQTSGFYLQPVHNDRASSSDAPPRITGYRAGNTVTVRVRDLAALGPMMDAVIEIGANDFNGLQFGLQDTSAALALARTRAVQDAVLRAGQLAQAADLALGGIQRMTENSSYGGPAAMDFAQSRALMSEAIAGGEVDVVAQVTMVFSIAPAGQ